MSACNFKPMEYDMPLIVMTDFEDEDGNFDEFMAQDEFQFAQELAENFSDDLTFFDVNVESGYYVGFQFTVTGKYEDAFDLDRSSPYCLDNDDAHCYFDMCRSEALRKADVEQRKIRKWLTSLKDDGYTELELVGIFSNGEGLYTVV